MAEALFVREAASSQAYSRLAQALRMTSRESAARREIVLMLAPASRCSADMVTPGSRSPSLCERVDSGHAARSHLLLDAVAALAFAIDQFDSETTSAFRLQRRHAVAAWKTGAGPEAQVA